jgi:hypothetical protein
MPLRLPTAPLRVIGTVGELSRGLRTVWHHLAFGLGNAEQILPCQIGLLAHVLRHAGGI